MSEPSLRIHTSNRLEVLAGRLAAELAAAPLPPLAHEVVVVQSQGMHRWVTLQLARRLGIAASLSMPFPRTFCHHLAEHLLAGEGWPASRDLSRPAATYFAREVMAWRLFQLLGEDLEQGVETGSGASPATYLREDPDQRKRFQLATRLAVLFDDYQLYRPDLVLAWEQDEDGADRSPNEQWQARLWRRLLAGVDEDHLARRFDRLITLLHRAERPPATLPQRLSVFGVTTLPPVFLRLLTALARFIPVTVYFVSPTYHFWGDLRSERESARVLARLRRSGPTEAAREAHFEAHFEEGNALLAALGRQGRDFFNLLQAADEAGAAWHELDFLAPAGDSALHALQADVLHLVDRGPGRSDAPLPLDPADESLRVHACHSPMREMEVLRDQLLAAFAADPELRPDDVLVLVTDVVAYTPYIQAVFGVEHAGTPALPISIADRPAGQEQPPAETVVQLLELVGSRVLPAAVFDLLGAAAVRRAFGIAESDVPTLRTWIGDTQVRWGIDAAQRREELDLPAEEGYSWRAGLDRLLMGYAAGALDELIAGVLPHAGDTAGNAELLGRLALYADTLFVQLRALRRPRRLDAWARDLGRALDALYRPEGEEEELALQLVRDAVDQLATAHELAGVREPVSLEVVRDHLRLRLADDSLGRFGSGFITGRITFGAAKPMRTIPFKVICFAGLGDGQFPRRDPPRSFDLMARAPRPGDRSLRDDDRYLFLETLLAAGERLVLTYVGRSQRDSSELAPSVVVSELLDVVDRTFAAADGRPARAHLVVEHRLQPFHPAYFDPACFDGREPRLFSYSRESLAASAALLAPTHPGSPFIPPGDRAPAADVETLELTLRELTEMWLNPSRHYCRQVLDLWLADDEAAADEAEPFTVDGLERYAVRQWLLDRRLHEAASGDGELDLLRARGELPLAGLGAAAYANLEREVRDFLARVPPHQPLPPLALDLAGPGWRLTGLLDDLTDRGRLRFRFARLKPKDLIRAWVGHVAWCAAHRQGAGGREPETLVIGSGEPGRFETVRFGPLADSEALLAGLVAGYRQGLAAPLPLFAQASFNYAEQRRKLADPKSRSRATPLERARQGWLGGDFQRGDCADPWVALAFRDRAPLAEEGFPRWAEALWQPILTAREEVA